MGNLRPLRVDLIFGTAKSHSESRLRTQVSDQARRYHLGSGTRYDYKVMRLVFLCVAYKMALEVIPKEEFQKYFE